MMRAAQVVLAYVIKLVGWPKRAKSEAVVLTPVLTM